MSRHRQFSFSRHYVAHGDFVYRQRFVPMFVKAYGPILEDSQGYRYFDAEAANGTASLGFDSTVLEESLPKLRKLPSIPSFCETDIRLKVAERIGQYLKKITKQSGRVAFELGGAQGIELALKIVRSNLKKSHFVVFEGAYHGRSIFTSQLSASHRYRSIMGDWRIPVVRLPYPDFEQNYSTRDRVLAKQQALTQIKRMVETEIAGIAVHNGEQDIAALVIEPFLNAGGMVKPDKDYLEKVVKIFKGLGAMIVVDEIFCGFYRTGKMFGFEHYNFVPDIVVMSKAITNGITPLSCVWARDSFMNPQNFPPGTHSATYINNPLALFIADTVLDRYEKWSNKFSDIRKLEQFLRSTITTIVKSSKIAGSGYALGGMGRILLKTNTAKEILDIARTIAREKPISGVHGLILASTGMVPNVVALNPPLNIAIEHMNILNQLLVKTFEKADKVLQK